MTPDDRRYTPSHEWVKIEGEVAIVGITDYAQHALGDITFVDLPKVGKRLEAGHEFGAIDSVKASSDIFAPVGGEVMAVNDALNDAPERVNQDPYETGWLIKLKSVSGAEAPNLMDAAAYGAQLPKDA